MNTENSSVLGEESEDDFDWEEVEVAAPPISLDPAQLQAETAAGLKEYYGDVHEAEAAPSEKPNFEITIQTKGKQKGDPKCVLVRLLYANVELNGECVQEECSSGAARGREACPPRLPQGPHRRPPYECQSAQSLAE